MYTFLKADRSGLIWHCWWKPWACWG